MDSFYAGKPGVSFVLKGRFAYISPDKDTYQAALAELIAEGKTQDEAIAELKPQTMTECFSDVNYKDIWFNEFCIIDTKNKSDKDNGKVFRRTMKGPSDETHIGGVSEYIGQIVGPAGLAPLYEIADVATTHQRWEDTSVRSNDFIEYYGTDDQKHNAKPIEDVDLKVFETGKAGAIKLVPGHTPDDTSSGYVDTLKYNWYQFIDGGSEDGMPARIYVGVDFPFYEANFFARRAVNYTEDLVLEKTLDAPFYDEYHLDVPRGITGGSFRDFQRITKTANMNVYDAAAIIYDAANDDYSDFDTSLVVQNLDGKDIWVCFFYWNDPDGNEHRVDYPIYVGTISDIRRISDITADGSFTVYYTNNTSKTYDKAFSWITGVSIDEHSVLSFTANNEKLSLPEPFTLRSITNVTLAGDATSQNKDIPRKIHIKYSDGSSDYIMQDEINYIQEIYYSQPGNAYGLPPYHLYVLFNAASHRYNPNIPGQDNLDEWVDLNQDGLMWKDLGYMRQVDQGLLVQTYLEIDATSGTDAIRYLNETMPDGLPGTQAGKLVGVKLATEDVYLMAYDYDNEQWFSIGNLQSAALDAIINDQDVIDSANMKGSHTTVWFNLSDTKPEVEPMSTPWTFESTTNRMTNQIRGD